MESRGKTLELGRRTGLMGILNVTPDSFYDGGRYASHADAASHGLKLIEEGADLIDIGGQSTRPGAAPIGADEELKRILPVLREIRKQTSGWISIDTYRSEVARVCLQEGADLINDVSSFRMDPEMPGVVATHKVPVVCMHFLESIHPMPANPEYNDLRKEIVLFFQETIRIATGHGIRKEQVVIDPGIGFGKKLEHNLTLISHLSFLAELERPILVGPSRKSFIGKITGLPAGDRLEGSAAATGACIERGAHIVRVHDVAFFRRYCDVLDALVNA